MRSRVLLFTNIAIAAVLLVPSVASAAGLNFPFFGPIIPSSIGGTTDTDVCALGWPAFIAIVNNLIAFGITIVVMFIAPLVIAYAGFLYVVNPVSPDGKSRANGMLKDLAIGVIVALSAWLIVDAFMAVLYHPDPNAGFATNWQDIIYGVGDPCLIQAGTLQRYTPTGVVAQATVPTTLPSGTGICDPATVMSLASAAGASITQAQANTFACLAKPESSCGAKTYNYSWNKNSGNGKASTAFGAFQVTLSTNHDCFENTACYQAAGVSGPLNCQQGFGANGFTAGGNATTLQNCLNAAANLTCNTAAAVCVMKRQGFGAWTTDANSSAQAQCIATNNI